MTETVRRAANNYLQKYSQTPPMSLKEESEVDLKFVNSPITDDELHLNVAYFVFLTRKYSDSSKKLGEQSYIERATQAGYDPFPAFNFNPNNVENQTTLFLGIGTR